MFLQAADILHMSLQMPEFKNLKVLLLQIICMTAVFVTMAENTETKRLKMESLADLRSSVSPLPVKFYSAAYGSKDLDAQKNSVFCPLGFSTLLTMLMYGSDGKTREEIKTTLNLPDNLDQLGLRLQELSASFDSASDDEILIVADKLYVQEGIQVSESFNDATSRYFKTHAYSLNFSNPDEASNVINKWVSEATKDKIATIINKEAIDESTRLVLLNAVYLKGTWAQKFDPEETRPSPFYVSETDTALTPMMNLNGKKFWFAEVPQVDAKMVVLPFTGKLSLAVLLPNKYTRLDKFNSELDKYEISLVGLCRTLSLSKVDLSLPKFKIEYEWKKLKNIASAMGIKTAFQPGLANLKNMLHGNEDLYVGEFVQKAVFEVNEEGAEAAAVTSMRIQKRSLEFPEKFEADHPFIFAVIHADNERELRNGDASILFQGMFNKPSDSVLSSHLKDEL